MSLSNHAAYLRGGTKMGDLSFIDTMIKDGLWDAFNGYHMGTTAENVARQWQITRAVIRTHWHSPANRKPAPRKNPASSEDEIAPVTLTTRKGRGRGLG